MNLGSDAESHESHDSTDTIILSDDEDALPDIPPIPVEEPEVVG